MSEGNKITTEETTETNKTTQSRSRSKSKAKSKTEKSNKLKLPRYMRLAKGGMWKDTEGEFASGAVVYSLERIMVGKDFHNHGDEIPEDMYNNQNTVEYGFIEKTPNWYIDLKDIPTSNLSRIILAYKHGILVKADPKNPPKSYEKFFGNEWTKNKDNEIVFNGENKSMFNMLMNKNINSLFEFIDEMPYNKKSQQNLIDLLDYEKRGLNRLSRPRLEVLEKIRKTLNHYGPAMTPIRKNDIEKKSDGENK